MKLNNAKLQRKIMTSVTFILTRSMIDTRLCSLTDVSWGQQKNSNYKAHINHLHPDGLPWPVQICTGNSQQVHV